MRSNKNKNIKLLYISPRDLLKARSDPIHIMASCKAFSDIGVATEVVAPYYRRTENIRPEDIPEVYDVDINETLKVDHLPTSLTDESSLWMVRLKKVIHFSKKAVDVLIIRKEYKLYNNYIIYSKCYISVIPFILLMKIMRCQNVKLVFEASSFQNKFLEKIILKSVDNIIAINKNLENDIVDSYGIEKNKIMVPPLGVNDSYGEVLEISRKDARKLLNINPDKKIALYSGKIIAEKCSEVSMIIEAAMYTPDITYIFTGGKQEAIKYFSDILENQNVKNVEFTGFFDSLKEPLLYMKAANVLVSFYPSNIPTIKYMVPNKIIQYARSKTVIISAYYQAIELMIGPEGAVYVEPENTKELSEKINETIYDNDYSQRIAKNAYERMEGQSINDRAQEIISFIISKKYYRPVTGFKNLV